MSEQGKTEVCEHILKIMRTYHEQDEADGVDTPGGLEHMGDVWRLFLRFEEKLLADGAQRKSGAQRPATP